MAPPMPVPSIPATPIAERAMRTAEPHSFEPSVEARLRGVEMPSAVAPIAEAGRAANAFLAGNLEPSPSEELAHAPIDARTARRLEELVDREVRLQQAFAPGAVTIRKGRISVMVVDDLPDARKILSIYLSRTGYHVVSASTAEDCLAKLRHHDVDAIVLDANMPGGGGAQVCRLVRTDPTYAAKRDMPIIVYTAYPEDYPPNVVEQWQATEYVVKGGDMLPLITALVRHTEDRLEARP
jgi:CheY-like chemotaxis protein